MSQKLTFTTANVLNTTVSNVTDVIYYDIQTPEWESHQTTIRRLDPHTRLFENTGVIRSEAHEPTEVSLYDGAFEPLEQWIKRIDGNLPGESRWQFDDGEGNGFAWCLTNNELELYSADEGIRVKRPLATFHQHKRYLYVGSISQYAYVEIENSVLESVDAIILSLVIMESKRRTGTLA